MFNIKQGIDPRQRKLPDRMAGKPPLTTGPLKGVTLQNEEMVKYHWEGFGWDRATGIPLQKTLEDLEIPRLLDLELE